MTGANFDHVNMLAANDPDKSNVSQIRTWLRHASLLREMHHIASMAKAEAASDGTFSLAGHRFFLGSEIFPGATKLAQDLAGGVSAIPCMCVGVNI